MEAQQQPSMFDLALLQVAQLYGVTVQEMRGRRKMSPLPAARRRACKELRLLGLSMPAIGRMLGGLHYTTVLYHLNREGVW